MADALHTVFPQNSVVAGFYLPSFVENIWTIYLLGRLLDEDFHVVVLSEPLLCLGSTVYFERCILTVITWR